MAHTLRSPRAKRSSSLAPHTAVSTRLPLSNRSRQNTIILQHRQRPARQVGRAVGAELPPPLPMPEQSPGREGPWAPISGLHSRPEAVRDPSMRPEPQPLHYTEGAEVRGRPQGSTSTYQPEKCLGRARLRQDRGPRPQAKQLRDSDLTNYFHPRCPETPRRRLTVPVSPLPFPENSRVLTLQHSVVKRPSSGQSEALCLPLPPSCRPAQPGVGQVSRAGTALGGRGGAERW